LGSGSRGNSLLVASGQTKVLFDCGLSATAIANRLRAIGQEPADLKALILSHEHADHVQGARLLASRYKLPVFISQRTFEAAPALQSLHSVRLFEPDLPFLIGELEVNPFTVCHDAAEPVGFTVTNPQVKLGIAMDLGTVTNLVTHRLTGCHMLVLEFNHDKEMLLAGPYPWEVKERIRGRNGHLSNDQSSQLLHQVADGRLEAVVLAHLSEMNNSPIKAVSKAEGTLKKAGLRGVKLFPARQRMVGEVISLNGGG
jgi:phosphoribosyl 1,2-cyclic phosphodiesterase